MAIYSGFTWIYPFKKVIFHSYVSLPEGTMYYRIAPETETVRDGSEGSKFAFETLVTCNVLDLFGSKINIYIIYLYI